MNHLNKNIQNIIHLQSVLSQNKKDLAFHIEIFSSLEDIDYPVDNSFIDFFLNVYTRLHLSITNHLAVHVHFYPNLEGEVAALDRALQTQRKLRSPFSTVYLKQLYCLYDAMQLSLTHYLNNPPSIPSDKEQFDFKEQLNFKECIEWIIRIIAILSFFYERLPDEQTAELIELQKVENKIVADQLTAQQEQMELTKEQNELIQQVLELMESLNDETEALPMDGDELLNQVDTLNEDKHLIIDQSESPKDTDAQNNDNTELKGQ